MDKNFRFYVTPPAELNAYNKERQMAKSDLREELESLKADMSKLRGDVAHLLETLLETGKSSAASAKADLESRLHERLDELRSALKRGRDKGEQAVHEAKHRIETRPFLSIFTAFGIGLILGKILDRR